MEKMKNSGIEWKRTKIKYNGDFWNGLTYSPQDLCDEGEGTLVLRSSNIKNGKMAFDDNVYVKCPIEPKSIIKKNDILICSRNGSKELIGKNAIFEEDEKMAFGAFIEHCKCIIHVICFQQNIITIIQQINSLHIFLDDKIFLIAFHIVLLYIMLV